MNGACWGQALKGDCGTTDPWAYFCLFHSHSGPTWFGSLLALGMRLCMTRHQSNGVNWSWAETLEAETTQTSPPLRWWRSLVVTWQKVDQHALMPDGTHHLSLWTHLCLVDPRKEIINETETQPFLQIVTTSFVQEHYRVWIGQGHAPFLQGPKLEVSTWFDARRCQLKEWVKLKKVTAWLTLQSSCCTFSVVLNTS